MFSSSTNEIIGMVGGATVSASLIPQVVKTARSRSTADISYAWQFAYIFGLAGINYYALAEGLWPVYLPGLMELALIVALTGMKFSYEWGSDPQPQP
jgi:MtN3 and saliva related transmembrane protein